MAHVKFNRTILLDHVHRVLNNRQVDKAKEVHLQKSDVFGVVLVVHHHRRIFGGGTVQRRKVINRGRRNHHATSMHTGLARQIFELFSDIPQVLVTGTAANHRLQGFRAVTVFQVIALFVFTRPSLL